jgi:hypothetical protein
VATAFVYYDRIVEYKGSVRPATLIEDADRLMLGIWDEPSLEGSPPEARRIMSIATTAALCGAVMAAYLALLFR